MASRSPKTEAPASSGVLPWLSDAPASSGEDEGGEEAKAEEQATPAIPMKAVQASDSTDPTPAEAEESATGSVPAQGVTGSRMARASSKKTRRSVPSWDEILFGSKS